MRSPRFSALAAIVIVIAATAPFVSAATYTTLNDPAAAATIGAGTFATGVSGSTVVGSFADATGDHGFITTVPEPASFGLLAFGAAGLLLSRRRAVYCTIAHTTAPFRS